jgi:hypothetical protein
MSYDLTFGRQAKKEIKALDTATVKRIEERFRQLSNNPFDPRISKPNKVKHLLKDCVTMGHSPNSPFCVMSYTQTYSNRSREFSDFF